MENNFQISGPPGPVTTIGGKEFLYFAGTSYFSLHSHPDVIAAAGEATKTYGINSATTRNGYGTTPLLISLEETAAAWFGTESAVSLSSGYLTSWAGLRAIMHLRPFDLIFADEYCHYSILMASETFQTGIRFFSHRNPEDLKAKVDKYLKPEQCPLLVTDGVFAVYGNIAPLPEYLDILTPYDGMIWVDDAHASGILGATGKGTVEYYNMQSGRIFTGTTLSKAFGGYGGLIAGKSDFIRSVTDDPAVNGASLVPVPALAAAKKGFELLADHPEWRNRLLSNANYLKAGLRRAGIELNDSPAPVASFTPAGRSGMMRIHQELMTRGIAIQFTHYIGAPPDGVLRIVVFSTHTHEQIDYLLDTLNNIL